MYAVDPGLVDGTLSPNLSMFVMVLGLFIVIVGIVISAVVYRESREWKKMILPIFDRSPDEAESESSGEPDEVVRQGAAIKRAIFSRVFGHMDVAGLLGGGATVIVGVMIILIGLALNG